MADRAAALDHREPDLVPIDFSDHRSSGVAAIVYPKQCECLGLPATTIRATPHPAACHRG